MSTSTLCQRCGRTIFTSVSGGTGAPTTGYCTCSRQSVSGDILNVSPLYDWRDSELARLRAELAAMTERKDGWRRVALAYRERLRELYPELRDELAWTHRRQVNIANEDTKEWSMDRREARNGHTD